MSIIPDSPAMEALAARSDAAAEVLVILKAALSDEPTFWSSAMKRAIKVLEDVTPDVITGELSPPTYTIDKNDCLRRGGSTCIAILTGHASEAERSALTRLSP